MERPQPKAVDRCVYFISDGGKTLHRSASPAEPTTTALYAYHPSVVAPFSLPSTNGPMSVLVNGTPMEVAHGFDVLPTSTPALPVHHPGSAASRPFHYPHNGPMGATILPQQHVPATYGANTFVQPHHHQYPPIITIVPTAPGGSQQGAHVNRRFPSPRQHMKPKASLVKHMASSIGTNSVSHDLALT